MLFDRSGEVRPVIEEYCDSGVVLCEELDDCQRTKDRWGGIMTELLNGGVTGITSDDNSFLIWVTFLAVKAPFFTSVEITNTLWT